MQLSEEWLQFLTRLQREGDITLTAFPKFFKDGKRAERLLGEIIRQGLVDLDETMTRLVITSKGREVAKSKL